MEITSRGYTGKRLFNKIIMLFIDSPLINGRIRAKLYRIVGIKIESTEGSFIGRNVSFDSMYPGNIQIGKNTIITSGVHILAHYLDPQKPIHTFVSGNVYIGSNVFIGIGAKIIKPVSIGNGAVIAAGTIVNMDVPEYAIFAGVPGKLIGYRNKNIKIN